MLVPAVQVQARQAGDANAVQVQEGDIDWESLLNLGREESPIASRQPLTSKAEGPVVTASAIHTVSASDANSKTDDATGERCDFEEVGENAEKKPGEGWWYYLQEMFSSAIAIFIIAALDALAAGGGNGGGLLARFSTSLCLL